MYKFLEYGDAHYVVDYIYESDIYDEEKFLFAPDVDICNRRTPPDGFAEQNGRDAERAD